MPALIRSALMLVALLICVALIAAHGVRAVIFLIALALVATVPRLRAWKLAEHWLVGVTGSRSRALAVVCVMVFGTLAAVNLYQLVR